MVRPIVAIYTTILGALSAPLAISAEEIHPIHQLAIETIYSDEFAEQVVAAKAPKKPLLGFNEFDHARITSILDTTRQLVDTAKGLVQFEGTVKEGQEMMNRANGMFREVKEIIHKQKEEGEEKRDLLRKKYSDHDLAKVEEDDKRALDVARSLYETYVTFNECVDILYQECVDIINREISGLGLSSIEIVTHEKRNENQEGYNKVVIVTNELADRVKGRAGDGIVSYPFMWNDSISGSRILGVDGKWNCHDFTPDECCSTIKQSVPNKDTQGNHLECHIFVPYGGVGNPRRNDRVFINLSPDGRVHEPPLIQ